MNRFFKMSYHFTGDEAGVKDDFESVFNLNREFTVEQLIIFIKAFFYKAPFINDREIIDTIIPYAIKGFDDHDHVDEDIEDDINEENIEEELKELGSIDLSNIDDNLDKFKEQMENNKEFLKAVFVNFIHHMND